LKVKDVIGLLNANIICGNKHLERDVECAFASDLMSDVLTVEMPNIMLITGMANIQTMRTAEMSDAHIVVLVRNKKATPEMIQIAHENDMVLMEYSGSLFRASGILYSAGIKPVY
jgi:hypothetical protein